MAQGDGREARRVALVADDHDRQIVAGGLRGAVSARGVQAPFQFVALDDQRARDGAVAFAQLRVTDVHQEPAVPLDLRGLVRRHPVEPGARRLQERVDGAHRQSSGRSTSSRRRTGPVRL
ncbi:hypothetical protein ADK70_08045 [Streptomyces rimosus subsp. pseudoverticillatus]|nr:hypothetical protein ADK70_08045 [Streptomyces rimosus subsp. pseudoverticillatus]